MFERDDRESSSGIYWVLLAAFLITAVVGIVNSPARGAVRGVETSDGAYATAQVVRDVLKANPIVIDDDNGGVVDDHMRWWKRVRDSGLHVRFRGVCISSCTYGLMIPPDRACVEPTASFGFHLLHIMGTQKQLPALTDALIRRWYPKPVQEWLDERRPLKPDVIFMSAEEVVALGIYPACD